VAAHKRRPLDFRTLMTHSTPRFLPLLAALFAPLFSPAVHAVETQLVAEGIAIDAASLGKYTFTYPVLNDAAQNPVHKLREAKLTGADATLVFEDGAEATVTRGADGELKFKFAKLPADVKNVSFEMLLPIAFNQGGKWQIGTKDGAFPKEKATPPHLFQDHATAAKFTNYEGRSLALKLPEFSFLQLTDNREWNWAVFNFRVMVPMSPDRTELTVGIATEGESASAKALIDQFGQIAAEDWPDKVKDLAELKADVAAEEAWTAGLKPPSLDPFGGLPGSQKKLGLEATGFFHVEKKKDRWFLVDPAGNAWFHLGLCGMNPSDDYTVVKGRESTFAWLPERSGEFASTYRPDSPELTVSFHLTNMIRKYGEPYTPEAYTKRMIERVRKWGFNSAGAFSTLADAPQKAAQFPVVAHLPISVWQGVPRIDGIQEVWDPFDEKTRALIAENMARELPAKAADPLIVGYYIVNEPTYDNIPHMVPALKGSQYACKRRLVQWLTEKYGSVAAFSQAWKLEVAAFADLTDKVLPVATDAAKADVQEFTGVFLDEYFRFIAETFRRHDKNHLLIGSRLTPSAINNEQLCRIMGKYLDVVSYNYYTYGVDLKLLRNIYQWSGGKPMILSEFYWSAAKESGLTGGREVATQQERGLAYRNYVEQSAALGFVVGIEWFTLVDQAATGRWFQGFDGERANTGVISVTDRPWKGVLNEMIKTNFSIYPVWLGQKPPFAWDDARFKAVK